MRVLFAASECAPLVKVGGLADVVGGLPKALVKMGVEVGIALPFYESIKVSEYQSIKVLSIKYNNTEEKVKIFQTKLPETEISVYLFKNDKYLSSGPIYSAKSAEGSDLDIDRFSFFSKAVTIFCQQPIANGQKPFDIVHCHDWHTSLIPALLKIPNPKSQIQKGLSIQKPKTLLTIHNLGKEYQGRAETPDGPINILLDGITNADLINTVSPTYAKEIQTPEFGEGLEGNLSQRKDQLVGILNGIDYEVWNPKTDKFITVNYSVSLRGSREATDVAIYNKIDSHGPPAGGPRNDNIVGWQEGKARNKIRLLQIVGLPQDDKIPLFGMVSRIAEQKGFDILLPALEQLFSRHSGERSDSRIDSGQATMTNDIRVVILGTGDPGLENRIKMIEVRFKNKLKFITRFDEALAHQIYAGSDFFLMPSHFEPSGLGQLIAMRYGTLPIVRKIGGLADSVEDGVTGFFFEEYISDVLLKKLEEALNHLRGGRMDSSEVYFKMVQSAMQKDFSWEKSAGEYLKLYQKLLS